MIKKILVLALCSFAVACGGGTDDTGTPKGDPCESNGDQRCSGTVLEECVDGHFEAQEDCADTEEACVEAGTSAAASCQSADLGERGDECDVDADCEADLICVESFSNGSFCEIPCDPTGANDCPDVEGADPAVQEGCGGYDDGDATAGVCVEGLAEGGLLELCVGLDQGTCGDDALTCDQEFNVCIVPCDPSTPTAGCDPDWYCQTVSGEVGSCYPIGERDDLCLALGEADPANDVSCADDGIGLATCEATGIGISSACRVTCDGASVGDPVAVGIECPGTEECLGGPFVETQQVKEGAGIPCDPDAANPDLPCSGANTCRTFDDGDFCGDDVACTTLGEVDTCDGNELYRCRSVGDGAGGVDDVCARFVGVCGVPAIVHTETDPDYFDPSNDVDSIFVDARMDIDADTGGINDSNGVFCNLPGERYFCAQPPATDFAGDVLPAVPAVVECMNFGVSFIGSECTTPISGALDTDAEFQSAAFCAQDMGGTCTSFGTDGNLCSFPASTCITFCESSDGEVAETCPEATPTCAAPAAGEEEPDLVFQIANDNFVDCSANAAACTGDFECREFGDQGSYCARGRKLCKP